MSEKDSRDSFYFLNAYQDGITPGQKITISTMSPTMTGVLLRTLPRW